MKGGSYNRVVGITITPKPKTTSFNWLKSYLGLDKTSKESKCYILRIPRMGVEGEDVDGISARIWNGMLRLLQLPNPDFLCLLPR